MPKRRFAKFISSYLKSIASFYLFLKIILFVVALLAHRPDSIDIIEVILFASIAYGMAVLLDVAMNIERILYTRVNRGG
jgi:hypothetical protein